MDLIKMKPNQLFSLCLTFLMGLILAGSVSAQKYGGSLTVAAVNSRMGFDPAEHWPDSPGGSISHDFLIQADVTRGPGGTGEFAFASLGTSWDSMTGYLAESYEAHPTKIIFKLRRGFTSGINPPSMAENLMLMMSSFPGKPQSKTQTQTWLPRRTSGHGQPLINGPSNCRGKFQLEPTNR